MFNWKTAVAATAVAIAGAAPAAADTFTGTLFYTLFTGGANVNKIDYSYDDVTQTFSLSNQANIASTNGADGIIFDASGHLLIGGQGSGNVYMLDKDTGATLDSGFANTASFHLALDPTGNFVYTSDFGGPLEVLPISGATIGNAVQVNITGDEGGITQVAYAPTTGTWFYVNGAPNGGGNLGTINLATGATSQLFATVDPAHGLIYDSYTGLMTLFGDGRTGTFTQSGTGLLQSSTQFACDFDQGAVDGLGHALVAGCGSITFLDYSISHDITNPDYYTVVGGFSGIDDVAPLSGLGSNIPEPATLLLFGTGLVGVARRVRRNRRR